MKKRNGNRKKNIATLVVSIFLVLVAASLIISNLPFQEEKQTGISEKNISCTTAQRNAEICLAIYQPVCGKVNVQCVTEPCEPVFENFSNSCVACSNELVEYYTEGECNE